VGQVILDAADNALPGIYLTITIFARSAALAEVCVILVIIIIIILV